MKRSPVGVSKIRIEKIERIVLSKGLKRFCEQCKGERLFISVEKAVFYFDLTAREIFRLVEADAVHFYESSNGALFVCARSLAEPNRSNEVFEYKKL